MRTATGVGRQVTKADFTHAFLKRQVTRQVGGDPLIDLVLDRLGVHGLRRLPTYESNLSFAWPVMSLDWHPAQGFADIADQMPGGMQSCIQGATCLIDPRIYQPRLNRLIHVVHDMICFLDHLDHLATSQPAGVERLAAALGVENGRLQGHGKVALVRYAFQHFKLGCQVVVGEKQALGHHLHPHQGSTWQYK